MRRSSPRFTQQTRAGSTETESRDMDSGRRILTCYYLPKPGGFCRCLYRAMEGLAERGHTVHYLAVEPFPIDHPRIHFHRLRVPVRARQGPLFWFWFFLLAPMSLLRIAADERIDAAFAFGAPYALILQPVRLWLRCRLTVFMHGDAVLQHRLQGRRLWAGVERRVEAPALARAHLYTVSDELRRKITARHRRVRPASTHTLRNALPSLTIRRERARGGLPVRVATASVLYSTKNLQLLIAALARLPRRTPLTVTLYGEGPHRAALEKAAAANGLREDRLRLAGWVDTERLWSDVDVLAMPSLHEGSPLAVLEALALEVPVLASDIPAHREILPESALLPVDDPAPWASRLAEIAAGWPQAGCRLADAQRPSAQRLRFDWEARMAAAILGEDEP